MKMPRKKKLTKKFIVLYSYVDDYNSTKGIVVDKDDNGNINFRIENNLVKGKIVGKRVFNTKEEALDWLKENVEPKEKSEWKIIEK